MDEYRTTDPVIIGIFGDLDEDTYTTEVEKLVNALLDFVKQTAETSAGLQECAAQLAKDSDINPRVRGAFGYALTNVVMSGYYHGLKESKVATYVPFAYGGPEMILNYKD